jgi:hypothetical protein
MGHTIWFATDGETAARTTTQALTRHGFGVLRSFDLSSASAQWLGGTQGNWLCPRHGTEHCDCQYVVLLAYGPALAPVVITVQSCDGRSEVQLVEDANVPAEADALDPIALVVIEAAAGLPDVSASAASHSIPAGLNVRRHDKPHPHG